MAITVIGPTLQPLPRVLRAPILFIKREWSDPWDVEPELFFEGGSTAAAGQALGTIQVRRRYGRVKMPWEAAFPATPRESWDLSGYWVRVDFISESSQHTIFVGRILAESRMIHGTDAARSGVQTWVAYEPLQFLERINISESIWLINGEKKTIGWVPAFNNHDPKGFIVGNRSDTKIDGSYVFGGSNVWTNEQALEYILTQFVDDAGGVNPRWTLGGQRDVLGQARETLPMSTTQTAASIILRLVNRKNGVDFKIEATVDGFDLQVFALTAKAEAFAGSVLPVNPNTVELLAGQAVDNLKTRVVRSSEHRYGKIRVLGKRILACATLRGPDIAKKWGISIENEYKAGTGDVDSDSFEHDQARAGDKFRPVYQNFAAPDDWAHLAGELRISLTTDGTLNPGVAATAQNLIRGTATFLPMREGIDYTVVPNVDSNEGDRQPDFVTPQAWIFDDFQEYYVPVGDVGMGLSVLTNDWGVHIAAKPNHRLALNHFDGAADSETFPEFDYETLVATIAFRTDHRLRLEHSIPGALPTDGTMEIEVADAEFWYLAAGTVVGLTSDGKLRTTGPAQVLRNDSDRLGLIMAGAIARYFNDRARAEIVIAGYFPAGPLIGQILTYIEEGGDLHKISAPITSVEWRVSETEPKTIIKTGYAK